MAPQGIPEHPLGHAAVATMLAFIPAGLMSVAMVLC